ncbi:galactose-specific lectin nattectin-like [Epinephelus lanceolatus]|uniref:galactose-specific lectin nattectin-like n=1 Tax=Epinephelus lanceolatus TaxID=310571 RepID=UPI001446960A|nr:galactose-specific lectin nattectin-like [Epinephelus lanceolatus]XP_033485868.1 galactose-specific lectin nattectin-like [Epinephelus lanceolatus]
MASGFHLVFLLSVTSGLFIARTMSQTVEEETGPACPPDWTQFGSRCYLFNYIIKPWIDAEAVCISLGGNLASVHSADENAFLRDYIQRMTGARVHTWIGGFDAVHEGRWQWSDGSAFDYKRWSIGEPNNLGTEHCIEMNWGGNYWNDSRCNYAKHFVCVRDALQ